MQLFSWLDRFGSLACFGLDPTTPITSITGTPTIYSNGQSVAADANLLWSSDCAVLGVSIPPGLTGLTFDAPAGMINGTSPAVAGAPLDNRGPFTLLDTPPTMEVGFNVGESATGPSTSSFVGENFWHRGGGWSGGSGVTVNAGADGELVSWSSSHPGYVYRIPYRPGVAGICGAWTLQYRDSQLNTPDGSLFSLPGAASVANLSGPNAGTSTPVMVDPRDFTYATNGAITAISLANTPVGTGWQVATATFATGQTGAVLPVVQGGTITQILVLSGGSQYSKSNPPQIALWGGQAIGGDGARYHYNYPPVAGQQPMVAPTLWQRGQVYNLSDIRLIPPDPTTGQPCDPTAPLAAHPAFVRLLQAGKIAGCRWMDEAANYGNTATEAYSSDLMPADRAIWQHQATRNVSVVAVRYINTDPSSTVYSWSSTRAYTPGDPDATPSAPIATIATLTAGSTTIAFDPSFPLLAGSEVSGPGIEEETVIDSWGNLSRPATLSGEQEIEVTPPPYWPLPPTDAGYWLNNHDGSSSWGVLECRTAAPHLLTSGQQVSGAASTPAAIPFTGGMTFTGRPGGGVWVTGPDTFGLPVWLGGGTLPPIPFAPQTVASTSEIPVSWSVSLSMPYGAIQVPYDFPAAVTAQVPGLDIYLNTPYTLTDDAVREVMRRTLDNLGPDNGLSHEFSNEVWNGNFPQHMYFSQRWTLGGYAGAPWPPSFRQVSASVVAAKRHHDLAESMWIEDGRDPAKYRRLIGSMWVTPAITAQSLEIAAAIGGRVDAVVVATYAEPPATPATTAAFAAWSPRPLNSWIAHWHAYNPPLQNYWALHGAACALFNQPQRAVSIATATAASPPWTGGIAWHCYTFVDGSGNETTVGASRAPYRLNSGTFLYEMPALPVWAVEMRIYIGKASGAETLYATIPAGAHAVGSMVPLYGPLDPNAPKPPATCSVPLPPPPVLWTYEGGANSVAPRGTPAAIGEALQDDISQRDVVWAHHLMCQLGGCRRSHYYQAFNNALPWMLARGLGDLDAPALRGLTDFANGVLFKDGPLPVPPVNP